MLISPDSSAPYRDAASMRGLLKRIEAAVTRPWNIMEVCGGQTFTLSRYRLEELLPSEVKMLHGPGCPVCVTPAEVIDTAISIASRKEVILCSFGDMLRVPGTDGSLLRAKAAGADVRLLYSPVDAIKIARENPGREVVFLAIGFETTMPSYAVMVEKAAEAGIGNLSLLTSLYTVPAAVRAIKKHPDSRVDALLAAGHVCAVTGTAPYKALAAQLNMPVVVTGFEPADMLLGILRAVEMLERGESACVNAYRRVVKEEGNRVAQEAVSRVFSQAPAHWRGIGTIEGSGMVLRPGYEHFDARRRWKDVKPAVCLAESSPCIAGRIMRGLANPSDCASFGCGCTPDNPLGAPMVSAEGVCAAHYRYR